MGKTRFTLTVIGIDTIGWAYAPYKKPAANKKVVKDPNARKLFEVVFGGGKADKIDRVTGVKMYSFKKAKSNFDRDDIDICVSSEIAIGQVNFLILF